MLVIVLGQGTVSSIFVYRGEVGKKKEFITRDIRSGRPFPYD